MGARRDARDAQAVQQQRDAAGSALAKQALEDDSDAGERTPSEPEDWNSDDEPPQDHLGDDQICSRDGRVTKRIRRVGKGLEQPGQHDIVHLRYRVLRVVSEIAGEQQGSPVVEEEVDMEVTMSEDTMPLAVEFALRCMRIGECALVTAPAAYASKASPLCGRKLRSRGAGRLPPVIGNDVARGKTARKLRFLPATPSEFQQPVHDSPGDASQGAAGMAHEQTLYQAEVELLGIKVVARLTEDGRVQKQILVEGRRSRRTPRIGDVVTFAVEPEDANELTSTSSRSWQTAILGSRTLPEEDLLHILLSMKEREQCLARLYSKDVSNLNEKRLIVRMLRWRRRDVVTLPMLGERGTVVATEAGGNTTAASMRRCELVPGPSRLTHAIEDGSMVLVAVAPCGASSSSATKGAERSAAERGAAVDAPLIMLSWCMGQGSVPGYLEAAVATMRMAESAAFDVPEPVRLSVPVGPAFEGQQPLRRLSVDELRPLLFALLVEEDEIEVGGVKSSCTAAKESSSAPTVDDDEVSQVSAPRQTKPFTLPVDWIEAGDAVAWQDLNMETTMASSEAVFCFRIALLAATEAPDVGVLDEQEQCSFVTRERARGNALARVGRYAEAKVSYCNALDAVRRTPFYKAIFPTEHGRIDGAYTRDPCHAECPEPLAGMDEDDLERRKASMVALHLNSALCAAKDGAPAEARRHASVVLGAEPSNVKALFRRGSAALQQGDLVEALADLQRAAELQPQDRAIREELRSAKTKTDEALQKEKAMMVRTFQAGQRRQPAGNGQGERAATPAVVAAQPTPSQRVNPPTAAPAACGVGGNPDGSISSTGDDGSGGGNPLLPVAQLLSWVLRQVPFCRACARSASEPSDVGTTDSPSA